jgi:hypothetical protein
MFRKLDYSKTKIIGEEEEVVGEKITVLLLGLFNPKSHSKPIGEISK